MRISVIILTYNSEKYLRHLFKSLRAQTAFHDLEIIVVDNNSNDHTVAFLEEQTGIQIIKNKENKGFAEANNQGFEMSTGKFVLCLNHDVIMDEDYIERLADFLSRHSECAAVAGKVLKWDFENDKKTDQVDTLGFKIFKSHKVIDQSELVFEENGKAEVFGINAAAGLYRKEALEKVKMISGFYFDPDYGSYKEDVDLAYRLLHAGCKSYVSSTVTAYHDRWETGTQSKQAKPTLDSRNKRNPLVNIMSYQNHLTTLYKNEFASNLFWFYPYIFVFELQKFFYFLFLEPQTLKGLGKFINNLSLTQKKRRAILEKTEIKPKDISRWYH
ncbi:glycosyltransferase family 2 protein [Patescibacteria group bacterium]|nr:glycosyltransferase family 2 protein [Patescibacteria group bacterium]